MAAANEFDGSQLNRDFEAMIRRLFRV